MNTKYTPGPWLTDEKDHDEPYQDIKIKAGKHHTVCTVWIDDAPVRDFNAAQQANARLIAAAPRMAAALQRAAHMLAELPEQSPQTLALRTEIVDCIKQATPDYYGIKIEGSAA
jgi:hypothetical protein